jgi:hypothetical protein
VGVEGMKYKVKITVQCAGDHVVGVWFNTIEEKYPFYCGECDDDIRTGKYPWTLKTEIVPDED